MLTTQVQYWQLQETAKHNRATEDIGYQTLNENIRHNQVTEAETQRHNIATENYYNNVLSETTRHDIAGEDIQRMQNKINEMNAFTNQRNAATNEMNAATNRFSAVTGYSLGLTSNMIAQQNADTNERNANTRWLEWTTGTNQADTAARRTDVDEVNSTTNIYNAETQRGQLELGYDNLSQRKVEFVEKTAKDVADTVINAADLSRKSAETVSNILKNLVK